MLKHAVCLFLSDLNDVLLSRTTHSRRRWAEWGHRRYFAIIYKHQYCDSVTTLFTDNSNVQYISLKGVKAPSVNITSVDKHHLINVPISRVCSERNILENTSNWRTWLFKFREHIPDKKKERNAYSKTSIFLKDCMCYNNFIYTILKACHWLLDCTSLVSRSQNCV